MPELLPLEMIPLDAIGLLILTAAFTSFITAAVGIGGGVLLLAVMASLVPPAALIPVHGLVQFGSNGGRAWLTRRHCDWSLVGGFALGALVGAVLAYFIVVQLPLQWIQLAVAGFILFLVWGPKPKQMDLGPKGRILFGGLTTLVSMFVGATGPLVASVVYRQSADKLAVSATFASCMSVQHLLKLLVFSVAGFAFWQWLPLVLLMIGAGFVGTWLGLKVLNRLPVKLFSQLFKLVITLLALRLLWQGLAA
ncbi:sulfite exporter TauE/SafE family protein [Marinobacterium jannaschii]|uniref:sulfite exporter TauE/SafE family protein n=1 Tax=Marinobacterium jannaschii TaxID=64970 RepID=UPI000B26E26B|nr:sulfite exporter TauE/SafE family protein [Marinobacterium jannaschii]